MAEPVEMPAMGQAQEQAWHALIDLHNRIGGGWTLIGGQLVHLHCAERGAIPTRPTDDIDTVVDVRASPELLQTFTGTLAAMGFRPETSGDGIQHRWRRDLAQIDVLIPDGVGERAAQRAGAGGAPTIRSPGTTQALNRSETISVRVGSKSGLIPRPNLMGALVGKAAARTEIAADRASARHCFDFVALAGLVAARDLRDTELTKKDRQRLRRMLEHCRNEADVMATENAGESLERLARAAELD